MAEPLPLILTDASLKISMDGTEAGLTELACLASHIEITPDVQVTTIDTMCGSRDYPGTVKWSLVASLYQSFDPDATEEVLSAAVALGTPVAFSVLPYKSQPISATNPEWSGTVIPQPYSPINGDAGDASSVDLEWAIEGEPTKSITPGALAAREASQAGEPAPMAGGAPLATELHPPPAQVRPVAVEAGAPGAFLPSGAVVPASLGALRGLGAMGQSRGEAWAAGDHLRLGDGSEAHWDGGGWTPGRAE